MYVLVLITASVVGLMLAGGLLLARQRKQSAEVWIDAQEARLAAQAALEIACDAQQQDANWRTTIAKNAGVYVGPITLGRASATVVATDPLDGDLSSGSTDPVVLTSTASCGRASQSVSATFNPVSVPMRILTDASIACTNQVSFDAITYSASAPVYAWDQIQASGATISVKACSSKSVSGSAYSAGTGTNTWSSSEVPDLDLSLSNNPLAPTNVPWTLVNGSIKNCVIAPATTPWLVTNANGVYLIDCKNNDIVIENCRINGTLVLLNIGSNSTIRNAIHWTPAVSGYPALLYTGNRLTIACTGPLSEAATGTNYNPVLAPYQGSSNLTTSDVYPGGISGFIYSKGKLQITGRTTLTGPIISQDQVQISASVRVLSDPVLRTSPPPGFRVGEVLTAQPGSWKQLVN